MNNFVKKRKILKFRNFQNAMSSSCNNRARLLIWKTLGKIQISRLTGLPAKPVTTTPQSVFFFCFKKLINNIYF